MFAKSVRFNSHVPETPGPGNYDPLNQRRASGIVSFADNIQRFAPEKEQDPKLGPGYYVTPNKLDGLAKRRVPVVNSTFTDANKKLDDLAGSWKTDRKLFEDVITELTEKLRESEKSLKVENGRSMEARAQAESLQALCDQEVTKRRELEEKLAQLAQEGSDTKAKFEQDLQQRNDVIDSLQRQIHTFEENRAQAEENAALLTSRITDLEATRQSLATEHNVIVTQIETLQTELQTNKQEAETSHMEMQSTNEELSRELQTQQQVVCNLEAKIISTHLMLTASQTAFQEAQQQLQEMNQSVASLEGTLATKEAQWNKLLVEFKARVDKLMLQLKKKNETILGQREQVDKLNQELQHLQHQKLAADKQFNAQIQQLQDDQIGRAHV